MYLMNCVLCLSLSLSELEHPLFLLYISRVSSGNIPLQKSNNLIYSPRCFFSIAINRLSVFCFIKIKKIIFDIFLNKKFS